MDQKAINLPRKIYFGWSPEGITLQPYLKNLKIKHNRERAREYWGTLDENKKNSLKQEIFAKLTEDEKVIVSRLTDEELENSIMYRVYANFDQQLDSLRSLVTPIGAEVMVGESSFYAGEWGESVDENEQERNAAHGREKGYTSLLWPGEQIVKYENSKQV